MAMQRMMVVAAALLVGVGAAQDAAAFEDAAAKRSYALGMAIGNTLRSESIAVDQELYVQGFRDALSGAETRLSEEEVRAVVNGLQRELKYRKYREAAQRLGMLPGYSQGGPEADGGSAPALADIEVSFKLDPRLTRSMYMGDRWVSPPTYTYASPPQEDGFAIEARVRGRDTQGRWIDISPEWKPGDAGLLQVTPTEGQQVKLIVLREGESRVTLSYGGVTKELQVRAVLGDAGGRVEISQ